MTENRELPPPERAKRYRAFAEDARKEAERVTDRKVREAYIIIAERWEDMAADVEQRLARGKDWEVD